MYLGVILPAIAAAVSIELRPAFPDVRCEVTGFAAGARTISLEQPVTVDRAVSLPVEEAVEDLVPATSDCWPERAGTTFTLWPKGVVRGRFETDRRTVLPGSLDGSFVDANAAAPDERRVDCSLDGAEWRCAVPARRVLHLKLIAGDHAPVIVWDVEAGTDAGPQPLLAGGSVAGRTVLGDERPVANAAVTLLPLTAAHQSRATGALARLRVRSNAKGYFQFIGVPPGRYRLVSRVENLAEGKVGSIDVRAGRTTRIDDPVVHAPLAELEVILAPPVTRGQQRWMLRLLHASERTSEVVSAAEGHAGVDGVWTRGGLQTGTYLLRVLDEDGSELAQRELLLRGGLERVVLTLPGTAVRGAVTAGDRPVKNTVVEFGLDGRRIRATTDGDGRFAVTFPVPGAWRPALYLGPSSAQLRLAPVDIRPDHDRELLLEVPGGSVAGRVIGAGGAEVPAAVVLRHEGRIAAQTVTDDGRFELLGITAGEYTAEAEADDAFAGPVRVVVAKDERVEIDLRVEGFRLVTGSVTSGDGSPASGAIVRAVDPRTGVYEDTIADGRGAYSFRVKPGNEVVDLVVMAPPQPIALRRLHLGNHRNVSAGALRLAPAAGVLRVYLQRTPPWPILVRADGTTVPLGLLLAPRFGAAGWRELVNGAFELALEPGSYRICNGGSDCRTAVLAPQAIETVNFVRTP